MILSINHIVLQRNVYSVAYCDKENIIQLVVLHTMKTKVSTGWPSIKSLVGCFSFFVCTVHDGEGFRYGSMRQPSAFKTNATG